MAMELTTETKRAMLELIAGGTFSFHFRDGSVERLPGKVVVRDGVPMVVATEGFGRTGILDRFEYHDGLGDLAFRSDFRDRQFCSVLGARLEVPFSEMRPSYSRP